MIFHDLAPKWGLAAWLAMLWLMLPISLCSALAGPSRLLLIYPPLIGKLLRQGKALIFVYFITLQLFWVALIGFWLIFVEQNALGIVVVSVAAAALAHARAWGGSFGWPLNCDLPPATKDDK
jgi:hypothetical protein